jgi:hypothetical protein
MPNGSVAGEAHAIQRAVRLYPLVLLVASGNAAANTGLEGGGVLFLALIVPSFFGFVMGAIVRFFDVICPRGFVISWSVVVAACLVLLLLAMDAGSALFATLIIGFIGSFPYYFGYWLGNRLNGGASK